MNFSAEKFQMFLDGLSNSELKTVVKNIKTDLIVFSNMDIDLQKMEYINKNYTEFAV